MAELALEYPRRVQAQQMTQALADKQIAIFEAILADIRPLVGTDDPQRTLI